MGGTDLRERRRLRTAAELERVALELFAERGFDAVTVDEVAAAADISPRTFFRYFATKEDVLLADLHRRIDEFHAVLEERPPDEAPLVAVRRAFRAMSEGYQRDRESVLRWASIVAGTSALLSAVAATQTSFHLPVARLVAERLGVDPTIDMRPRIIANAVLGASFAAYERWLVGGARADLPTLTDEALDLVEAPSTWTSV